MHEAEAHNLLIDNYYVCEICFSLVGIFKGQSNISYCVHFATGACDAL
jgi:hypothetical protein